MLVFSLCVLATLAPTAGCSRTESAGQVQSRADRATATGEAARAKPFQASGQREPFHRAGCKWATKISVQNLIGYDGRDAALADDRRPCQVCRPLGTERPIPRKENTTP